MICILISFYAINFLPFIDFRAYKIGNDIKKEMMPSEDLIYTYIANKGASLKPRKMAKNIPLATTLQTNHILSKS